MGIRYKIPDDVRLAAVFDPSCVLLGADVIDWGSFGWGNTVIVDPLPLGIATATVQKRAWQFADMIGGEVATAEVTDEGRDPKRRRVAVCFTRKAMTDLVLNQAEWLGAIERKED